MEDLETLVQNPPPPPSLELLIQDPETSVWNTAAPRIGPLYQGPVMEWCAEITPVSPEDTIPFNKVQKQVNSVVIWLTANEGVLSFTANIRLWRMTLAGLSDLQTDV